MGKVRKAVMEGGRGGKCHHCGHQSAPTALRAWTAQRNRINLVHIQSQFWRG